MGDGQRAGLALFGVRQSWIGVVREAGKARLAFAAEGVETSALRTASTARPWRRLSPPEWLARFSWRKGSRPALFSYTRGQRGGWADFDWIASETLGFR